MAPSSSNTAEALLSSARDRAARDGLRAAVPAYLEAADALVDAGKKDDAAGVLAELLASKEKKKALFFTREVANPLGAQRIDVARRYAEIVHGELPSEASLDAIGQLALQFPDDVGILRSNAEALRLAGYLLDSLDEYKRCVSLAPNDVDLVVRLCDLYAQLGRADEAAGRAASAVESFASHGDDAAVALLAVRMLQYAPEGFEQPFDAFASLAAEALARNKASFDETVAAFERSPIADPARRRPIVSRISACYAKLLARDRDNQTLWKELSDVDAAASVEVRGLLEPRSTAPVPAPAPALPPADGAATVAQTPVEAPPPRKPAAASGLSAFAKRKAMELFANSEYEAASAQLERVVKMSPDVESLEMLLECYLALDQHDKAARVGVALADAELAVGNRPGAIATLTTLSQKIADPVIEQRRVELMQNKQ
jgi:tetratricopeptide (TPR) repeat protein